MHNFPGNWNPTLFTLSGVAVGALFLDDFTPNEQNSIGNWLILVGQVILTNAAQQVLIKGRQKNATYNIPGSLGSELFSELLADGVLDMETIKKAIDKIQEELNKYHN